MQEGAWIKTAKAGDKIVCIRKGFLQQEVGESFPLEVNAVYTVKEVKIDTRDNFYVYFVLREMGLQQHFGADLFKPVSKTDKGMRILKQLLKTSNKAKENELY